MRNAYFTLATDDYALGAYCLAKSIGRFSKYKLHVLNLNLSEENRSLLESVGCIMVCIEGLSSKTCRTQGYRENPNFANNCYNKIYLWDQEFDKVIYLDSDMLVVKNIDHLFNVEASFAACEAFRSEFCARTRKLVKAGWSREYFNGGFLVLKPNKKVYSDLMKLKDVIETPEDPSDQGLLNHYFKSNWQRLGPLYNFSKRVVEMSPATWARYKDEVFVLHFTLDKPWSEMNAKWWSVYNSVHG